MNTVSNITQNKVEVIPVWGGFKVQTTATVTIYHGKDHKEDYTIMFERDQVKGTIRHIECLPREENTTTEYTLTQEVVKDLAEEELTNI